MKIIGLIFHIFALSIEFNNDSVQSSYSFKIKNDCFTNEIISSPIIKNEEVICFYNCSFELYSSGKLIDLNNSIALLEDCTFQNILIRNNNILCIQSSNITIDNCYFSENKALNVSSIDGLIFKITSSLAKFNKCQFNNTNITATKKSSFSNRFD